MFKRIDHIALTVQDGAKSVEFYQKYFGFQKASEHDVPIPSINKIIYLKLGDTILELVVMPAGPVNQGYHFCLETDNFAADYSNLKEAGVPVESAPHPAGALGLMRAVFIGPDRESVEIRGK